VHPDAIARMKTAYSGATRRILFLDYNGTLIPRRRNPGTAVPDQDLYELLQRLQRTAETRIVLITGWSRDTIGTWFDRSSYCLIAEHGTWISTPDNDWQLMEGPHNEWIDNVRPLLDAYADRTPGAYVEQASHSLIWHYRKTNPELATIRAEELKNELHALIDSYHFELYQGNRMLELKNAGVNKGTAAQRLLGHEEYDFVAAVGDETSDEYLFARMPEHAWTLKVGIETGTALYTIENHQQVRTLLDTLAHS
jgi:trehalose 6-phosphate synthase/phosphatase